MHKVRLNNKIIQVPDGTILSDVIIKAGESISHPCGGKGTCKKCLVSVNGKDELSCQYKIESDIVVVLPESNKVIPETDPNEKTESHENCCICLDIGTTTLALALVSIDKKEIIKIKTAPNPQRAFGADVLNRIDYCNKNGVSELQNCLIDKINEMINVLSVSSVKTMYVSGNTTMLHLLFGVNPSSMGVAPYVPVFLESKQEKGVDLRLKGIENVISLPCISAFVGSDLVAGVNYTALPPKNKYNLLVDLGTNAEILLYNKNNLYCTSAAAGPCFEGASITCGMSATDGAIYSYSTNGSFKTIGNKTPLGICGTGLIDIITVLLEKGIIDETGYMSCREYSITDTVKVTQEDIRQYQLAKSAVYSGISALLKEKSTSISDIENVFISGGFSTEINIANAIRTGLLPKELKDKIIILNNSSLSGTVKFACEQNDLSVYTKNAAYIDLSTNNYFNNLFIKNMDF